ncbi:MAG: hypothetical protein WAT89_11980, partial [Candidatus Kapaibacterium sp.]
WPKDLKMDKEVVESVTSKWLEYGIPEKLMAGVEIVRGEKLLTELEARSGGGKIGNIESKEAQL